VSASGKSALLFWYREALYAIEPRSPAEGAYSEGFLTSRLTQDGCIECPTTKTTFDLKTGEIKAWYPDNPVLRALTPIDTCRPMEVFPVRVESNGTVIAVDFANSNLGAAAACDMDAERTAWTAPTTSGGANTSVERNNVYGIEPRVYLQDGSEVRDASGKAKVDPATLTIGIVAIAIVAVAGTAVAISKESIIGGVLFWYAQAQCVRLRCSIQRVRVLTSHALPRRIALLVPVGVYVFRNAEEGEGPKS
jgi:nitrite reductase/ring-hydroxylating ferredoxin subunit